MDTRIRAGTSHWDRLPGEIQEAVLGLRCSRLTALEAGQALRVEYMRGDRAQELWAEVFSTGWMGDLRSVPGEPSLETALRHVSSPTVLATLRPRLLPDRRTEADVFFRLTTGHMLNCVALRRGWVDLVSDDNLDWVAQAAAEHGAVSVLRDLVEVRGLVEPSIDLVDHAATGGQVAVLEFLHECMPDTVASYLFKFAQTLWSSPAVTHSMNASGRWGSDIVERAAEHGHLDAVVWLVKHRTDECGPEVMDAAATNGHLAVVRWLAEHRTEGCTKQAFVGAASFRHFEVLVYLHKRYPGLFAQLEPEELQVYGISCPRTIDFLHSHGKLVDMQRAFDDTVRRGTFDDVKHVHATYSVTVHQAHLTDAFERDDVAMIEWLLGFGLAIAPTDAAAAVRENSLSALNLAIARAPHLVTFMVEAAQRSSAKGYPLSIWLNVRHGAPLTQETLDQAVWVRDVASINVLLNRCRGIHWDLDRVRRLLLPSDRDILKLIQEHDERRRAQAAQTPQAA
ncbi:hypothetical protein HK105_206251 [Polyrhizophydium stewartii]|uniref:Ankyrin repeat protein n=1 Tax=Polyrhizophydium stewartii TaxID=2732419 RepID=A0ABR4N444_9FUNG|nr:hypothetical protein HK105_001651 [Polyrhizophydium stewartii]